MLLTCSITAKSTKPAAWTMAFAIHKVKDLFDVDFGRCRPHSYLASSSFITSAVGLGEQPSEQL